MIDASEVAEKLCLPPQDEQEVQRIGSEIVAQLHPPKFDGRPIAFEVPSGETEEHRDRAYRIVCALERRFQTRGWIVAVEPATNAFGEVSGHRLWFKIDGVALRTLPGKRRLEKLTPEEKRRLEADITAPVKPLPANPTLSVLLGTYNRRALLQRAVESVRASVGSTTYEIVVTDGGSTDGSREWLAAQPDVVLVGERRLDGAVRAFNQAHALCRGDFIANFNDDAEYVGGALAYAVVALQENPHCGQVALAYGALTDDKDWRISEVHQASRPTTYANFGVARWNVVEQVAHIQGGFWNPVYHTYAADCEFSAWVWRLGHTVDGLPRCRVRDVLENDGLRTKNQERFGVDTKRMYARWPSASFSPDGPEPRVSEEEIERYREVFGELSCREVREGRLAKVESRVHPAPPAHAANRPSPSDVLTTMVELCGLPLPEEERRLRAIAPRVRALDPVEGCFPTRAERLYVERVLHVSLATDADPQAGLCRALRAVGSGGYMQIDWTKCVDGHALKVEILNVAETLKPTLVFMQLQQPGVVDVDTVRRIRAMSPGVIIATWCGDVGSHCSIWGADGRSNMDALVPFERAVDLSLWSSMSHVRVLRAAGVHAAAYLQIGYDEEQYCVPTDVLSNRDTIDVAFLGSRYANEDAFSRSVPHHDGFLRDEIVRRMSDDFGDMFGLYGHGWSSKTVALRDAHTVYQRSKIGLSISLLNDLECYTSDRLFRILGCGAALLVKRFPGMSVFGLEHEKNCLVFDAKEAVEMAQDYLRVDEILGAHPDGARHLPEIAAAGAKLVRENHTWSVRMLELVPYLAAVREARTESRP